MEFKAHCGDILLLKGTSPLATLIKLWTKSEYSHSAMYINERMIVESDIGGVQFGMVDKYNSSCYDVYRHNTASYGQLVKAANWSILQKGKWYDYLGLIGIATRRSDLDQKNMYWCSEFNMDAYIQAGIDVDCECNTRKVTPSDIANDLHFTKVGVYIK